MFRNKTPTAMHVISSAFAAFIITTLYGEYVISRDVNIISLYVSSLAEVLVLFYAFRMAYLFLTKIK